MRTSAALDDECQGFQLSMRRSWNQTWQPVIQPTSMSNACLHILFFHFLFGADKIFKFEDISLNRQSIRWTLMPRSDRFFPFRLILCVAAFVLASNDPHWQLTSPEVELGPQLTGSMFAQLSTQARILMRSSVA